MRPLLDIDSLAYKRRLVRELNKNHFVNGFYCNVEPELVPGRAARCVAARVCNERIEVRTLGGTWFRMISPAPWDTNGIEICASRTI